MQSSPVATLTLNPAVDVSYEIPRLIEDEKVHATHTRYDPGGNGINVARGLKELGVSAHCCTLVAGESGSFLSRLLQGSLDHPHFVEIEGETRINCTVIQQSPRRQFEVDGTGPEVAPSALEEISRHFLERCQGGIGVITGSIPPGVPETIYAQLTKRIRKAHAQCVVDAGGELLRAALAERPFLVKPNRYELEQLAHASLPTREDVVREARRLCKLGIDNVCVSLGGEGAIFVNQRKALFCPAPSVTIRSTVGSGDSMVAGLVAAFHHGLDETEALRLGVACGSATATQPGTRLFTRAEAEHYRDELTVRELDVR